MKSKSVYRSLVVSNFAVLLVAIIVAVVGFGGYARFGAAQARDYNQVILRQIRSTFDEKMNSINELLLDISSNNDVMSLRFAAERMTDLDRYRSVKVMQSLENYVSVNHFIDSICLYYSATDRVITNVSYYASTTRFLETADCAYWDEAGWKALFTDLSYRIYRMSGDIFTVVSPLSYGSDTYVVMNIDSTFIHELTQNIRALEKSLIAVRDEETAELLFSFGNESLSGLALSTGEGTRQVTLENGRYTLSSLPSMVSSWMYYFVLPENAFIEQASDLLTLFLVLLLLLGGVVICIMLARHNFQPIKSAAALIIHSMEMESGEVGGRNELELIREASARAIDEYRNIRETMTKYIPLLRSKLLDQILKGVLMVDDLTEQDIEASGIRFPHEEFYIALLSVQDSQDQAAPLARWMGLHIMEYMEGLVRGEDIVYCVEMNLGRIGVLANAERYDEQRVRLRMRQTSEYCYRNFGTLVTAAVSYCGEGAEEIPLQYVQCVRALEHELIRYPGEVVFTDSPQEEKGVYYYPAEMEMRLINSVKSGNLKNVNAILDTVILENFINSSLTAEVSTCLFFNLMGTAIKVINTLGYSATEIFGSDADYFKKITSCSNLQDMEATLRGMFYCICVYLNDHKDKEGRVIDRIIEHITLNSADPNLSLHSVAEAFGLNPNYLSGYFKEQAGENFLACLNRVRLDKAKLLLRDTALGLGDVATKTGYSSNAVLIRNFKKHFGLTPGQYREQSMSER